MPPKRKPTSTLADAPPPADSPPTRASTRARRQPSRPSDDNPNPATSTQDVPPAATDPITISFEALRNDVAGQLAQFDTAIQANAHGLDETNALLQEIRETLNVVVAQLGKGRTAPVSAPAAAALVGNDSPVQQDILS